MTPANVPTEARFGRVVTPAMDEEAERRVSKSELKVEVYTPLVTVPALPEMEPLIVLVKVLVSARRVVEAMMMFVDPLKETPLMVRAFWSVVAVPALPPMVRVEVETE